LQKQILQCRTAGSSIGLTEGVFTAFSHI